MPATTTLSACLLLHCCKLSLWRVSFDDIVPRWFWPIRSLPNIHPNSCLADHCPPSPRPRSSLSIWRMCLAGIKRRWLYKQKKFWFHVAFPIWCWRLRYGLQEFSIPNFSFHTSHSIQFFSRKWCFSSSCPMMMMMCSTRLIQFCGLSSFNCLHFFHITCFC